MDPTPSHLVARLRRRIAAAEAVVRFTRWSAVGCVAVAAGLLLARVLEVPLRPNPWWLLGLLIPVAAAAVARRRGDDPRRLAAHLDLRAGADGLLMAASEVPVGAWRQRLEDDLRRAERALPGIAAAPMLRRVALPAALLVGVLLLPPPELHASTAADPAVARALAELEDAIELAEREGLVEEQKLAELRERVQELRQDAANGEAPTWADVDGVQARLQEERGLRADALQRAASAMQALSAEARAGEGADGSGGQPLQARMQELLEQLAKAGMLEALAAAAPELAEALRDAAAGLAELDAAALQRLAEAFGQLGLEQLAQLQGVLEGIDPQALADLRQALQGCVQPGGT